MGELVRGEGSQHRRNGTTFAKRIAAGLLSAVVGAGCFADAAPMDEASDAPVDPPQQGSEIDDVDDGIEGEGGRDLDGLVPPSSPNGSFYVKDNKLFDFNGKEFLIRGVSTPWSYYPKEVYENIKVLKTDGKANTVRVVIDRRFGHAPTDEGIKSVIRRCVENKLAVVLTLMDYTGLNSESDLKGAADFWISKASWLRSAEFKKYVMINIANEWLGMWGNYSVWMNTYKREIKRMRDAGLDHTLVVDAEGYGQETVSLTHDKFGANQLVNELNGSVDGYGDNILFALHMYDNFYSDKIVRDAMTAVERNLRLPGSSKAGFIIEEFAADHHRGGSGVCPDGVTARPGICPVAENTIINESNGRTTGDVTQSKIGWIAWSWKGNNSDLSSLDISTSWNSLVPTSWGSRVVSGANGLAATSVEASIFGVNDLYGKISVWQEAESGVLTGLKTSTAGSGYSGLSYVDGETFDAPGHKLLVTVDVPSAKDLLLQIKYRIREGYGNKINFVKVNGGSARSVLFENVKGSWGFKDVGIYRFEKGRNAIEIAWGWGYMDIDAVKVFEP